MTALIAEGWEQRCASAPRSLSQSWNAQNLGYPDLVPMTRRDSRGLPEVDHKRQPLVSVLVPSHRNEEWQCLSCPRSGSWVANVLPGPQPHCLASAIATSTDHAH